VLASLHLLVPGLTGGHVRAQCALVRRAFPHASLSDTAFLDVPGYIAGVTNPIFEAKT
jgi:hypothetical protein